MPRPYGRNPNNNQYTKRRDLIIITNRRNPSLHQSGQKLPANPRPRACAAARRRPAAAAAAAALPMLARGMAASGGPSASSAAEEARKCARRRSAGYSTCVAGSWWGRGYSRSRAHTRPPGFDLVRVGVYK